MKGNDAATAEAELRALIDERVRAIRAKDVDAVLAVYAPDVLVFDLIDPLRHTGRESVGKRLEGWLSQFREGPIGYELRDLQLTVGGDAAFSHCLSHVDATTTDGN